jgi:hypothetical protein
MTTEIQTLALRVEKLERQNHRLFCIGVVSSFLLVTLGLVAAGSSKPRTVEAEQFILRDGSGRARVTIGTPAISGAAVLMPPDEPALWFSDAKGADRLILAADGLRLADSKGKAALDVIAGASASQPATIRLYDSTSKVVWSVP